MGCRWRNNLKTTDGGNNWIQQNSNTTNRLLSVYFIDNQTGWAGGDDGILLKTTDGGNNWLTGSIPTIDHVYEIVFLNNDIRLCSNQMVFIGLGIGLL